MAAAAAAAFLIAAGGTARAADAGGLVQSDRDFVNKAAQGSQMEVLAGKLAAQRALNPAVKEFGEKMVSDHTAAGSRLKTLADSKQFVLPDDVSAEEHIALGKLESLVGTEFDKTYSKMMVDDHVQDIKEFQQATGKEKVRQHVVSGSEIVQSLGATHTLRVLG